MGKMLEALLQLQAVERQVTTVRNRLDSRKNAVTTQQRRIEQAKVDWQAAHDRAMQRRKEADRLELDLKSQEAHATKLRGALNTAKTNKEYAAILTQLNTEKADNAKLEEAILKVMQDVDADRAQAAKLQESVHTEEKRLEDIRQAGETEVTRLSDMLEELKVKRAAAAQAVPREALVVFERIAENYQGEAMAAIEIHGKRPPHDYICGGCFMSLTAEHANALRVRDEIRRCDNCGRILYLEPEAQGSPT